MIKRNGKTCKIKEQFIDDKVTGLMLIFRVTPNGEARLHLLGDSLPFGNRDFQFSRDGELVGTGTGVCPCRFKADEATM
jgi:hypothetical protein